MSLVRCCESIYFQSLRIYPFQSGISRKLTGTASPHLRTNPEQLISALEEVVTEVKTEVPVEGEEEGQMVALYGLGQTAAGPTIIPQIARIFLETLYLA
jgi:hypothetical protein